MACGLNSPEGRKNEFDEGKARGGEVKGVQ